MARRSLSRWLATFGLVLATSTGVLVTSANVAAADTLTRGPADRLALKLLVDGTRTIGTAAGSPGAILRANKRCLGKGPGTGVCAAVTNGALALGRIALRTDFLWMPYAEDFFTGDAETGTKPPSACGGSWATQCQGTYIIGHQEWIGSPTPSLIGVRFVITKPNQSVAVNVKYRCKGMGDTAPLAHEQFNPGNGAELNFSSCNNPGGTMSGGFTYFETDNGSRHLGDYYFDILSNGLFWKAPAAPPSEVTTTIQCRRGTDLTTRSLTAAPVEGDVAVPGCPEGWDPETVTTEVPGRAPIVEDLRPTEEDKRLYPECVGASCLYQIAIDGRPCVAGDLHCSEWTQVRKDDPAAVKCLYGPYVVDPSLCDFMEDAYKGGRTDGRTVITRKNADGDPATRDDPDTSPNPRPTPSATGPLPTRPPVPTRDPDAPVTPKDDPLTPAQERSDCWPNGWGMFNPANWVLQPTKCALRWAFVAPPGTFTGVKTDVQDAWDRSPIGVWTGAVPTVWDSIGGKVGSGGCMGPRVETGLLADGTGLGPAIYPFNACNDPVKKAATISHALSSFAVSFFGGLKCMQIIGSGFGWVPPIAARYASYSDTGHGWK